MALTPVQHCVTRRIWSRGDAVLLIFAGAAAEFALNRAVDWLFVTGALPRDPIGRVFRTVRYAQRIAFGAAADAQRALEQIGRAHAAVEAARGQTIPAWAHRAVLYMLIYYSERAHTLLEGSLAPIDQQDLYDDFRRIGEGLGIPALPPSYETWGADRVRQVAEDLAWSDHTAALYAAYRHQLGPWRYALLRRVQAVLLPPPIRRMLRLPSPRLASAIDVYQVLRAVHLGSWVQRALVPPRYWAELRQLDLRHDTRRERSMHAPAA
ncbi:MAG TPA: oxygenase MpaB family protein [Gemmatimonadales bacterium]|nr:oxygenase MpaB family protein [Gemmatimonadales bacterium]